MDFTGTSFISKWKNGLLRIRALQLEPNTFELLNIILDAAVKQGKFRIAWDLQHLESLSTFQFISIISPSVDIKHQIEANVTKTSIVVPTKYASMMTKLLRYVGPTTPYYIGSSAIEAKQFVS